MVTSTTPYLLRALHQWCTDQSFTPHIVVDTAWPGVEVPQEFVENDSIVLNVAYSATEQLLLDNEWVQFSARFGGIPRQISVPMDAVRGIYARENQVGMGFPEPGLPAVESADKPEKPKAVPQKIDKGEGKPKNNDKPKNKKPTLKLV